MTNQASHGGGLFSQVQKQYQKVSTNVFSRGSESSNSQSMKSENSNVSSFPLTGGHVLGGVSRRTAQSTVDPRRARLQAIERRMNAAEEIA
mmetsp:Transcript_25635/g.62847  ORF Transcript_25635/g.62847 Transcript_25635/m.62847 type:complete len:91 (+) Transcript_25635:836-1108(+)